MAIARRTGFAAPLVMVIAGCGNKPASDPPKTPAIVDAAVVATGPDAAAPMLDAAPAVVRTWTIGRRGVECVATDDPCSRMVLPPGSPIPPCNPPAPIKIACPPDGVIAIVERTPDHCETKSAIDCAPGHPCPQPAPVAIDCPRY